MQCPNCGFENIPGRQTCGMCSGALSATAASTSPTPASVYPPRARDRRVRDQVSYALARHHLGHVGTGTVPHPSHGEVMTSATLYDAGDAGRRVLRNAANRAMLKRIAIVTASIIPGVGHELAWKDRLDGRWHMLGASLAIILAGLFYRTRIADVMLVLVIGLSIASVVTALEGLDTRNVTPGIRRMRSTGRALLTFATYFGTYVVLSFLLDPIVSIQQVVRETASTRVAEGDTLFLRAPRQIARGDTVVGLMRQEYHAYNLGPVVGIQGDTVTITPEGQVYVNNRRTSVALPAPMAGSSPAGTVALAQGEVWVPPAIDWRGETNDWAQTVANMGVMERMNISGRAIAVLNPPAHRGIVRPQALFERAR